MKKLDNRKTNILSRKPKYYKNKKYISHIILTTRKLRLKYNKLQLITIIRLKINN